MKIEDLIRDLDTLQPQDVCDPGWWALGLACPVLTLGVIRGVLTREAIEAIEELDQFDGELEKIAHVYGVPASVLEGLIRAYDRHKSDDADSDGRKASGLLDVRETAAMVADVLTEQHDAQAALEGDS